MTKLKVCGQHRIPRFFHPWGHFFCNGTTNDGAADKESRIVAQASEPQ
jgi:hypothetical protein